jgi:hypothetical protein
MPCRDAVMLWVQSGSMLGFGADVFVFCFTYTLDSRVRWARTAHRGRDNLNFGRDCIAIPKAEMRVCFNIYMLKWKCAYGIG